MVRINKKEKSLLAKAFPAQKYPHYYCYPRTMKQDSKREHYFCVEAPELLAMLHDIRQGNVVEEHGEITA